MHIIIGKGNLGLDLKNRLELSGKQTLLLTRSEGFKFPQDLNKILHENPECIWICYGSGSISEAKRDFGHTLMTNVLSTREIMDLIPHPIKLVFFSSNYAAHEEEISNPLAQTESPSSLYALSKIWMEDLIKFKNRPLTACVRVGTLYGKHFPEKSLPGKLRRNYPTPCEIKLPMNMVTPTPTELIADILTRNFKKLFFEDQCCFHNVAPVGHVSVARWGRLILDDKYTIIQDGFDMERPCISSIGCSLEQTWDWEEAWERYKI